MTYPATVVKVMIASPSDVAQPRLVIRRVIDEWNAVYAGDRKVVLMPIGWETNASPEMGDRPQAIINKQLLQDSDLLVAVFWTRIGSPTGVARSGTVEEIEEHLKAGKPALIYFSSEPVRPDSVDDEQYGALKSFKESLKQRGLFEEYADLDEFRTKFSRHLAQTVIRNFQGGTGSQEYDVPLLKPMPTPTLSPQARELLLEASKDRHGMIMRLETLAGSNLQTNNKAFGETADARSTALWRRAVDELDRLALVEDRAGRGDSYYVTDEGFRVADLLARPDRQTVQQAGTARPNRKKELIRVITILQAMQEEVGRWRGIAKDRWGMAPPTVKLLPDDWATVIYEAGEISAELRQKVEEVGRELANANALIMDFLTPPPTFRNQQLIAKAYELLIKAEPHLAAALAEFQTFEKSGR